MWHIGGGGATYRWQFATPSFPGTIRFNVPADLDTFATFRSSELDSLVAGLGVAPGDSISGQWRAYAYAGTDSLVSNQTFNVTLKRAVPPTILIANPGPSNNGGAVNWAMFLNLTAGSTPVDITNMTTASTAAAGASYSIEFFTRSGNALGGPVTGGPGSSSDGWTSLGSVPVTQGSTASGVSLLFATPSIHINAGDTVGVAMKFNVVGPRYFGTGTPPYETYSDANLTLVTGDGRSAPFTPTGTWFASRALVGEIHYSLVTVGVREPVGSLPQTFNLSQNYPNPFNPTTKIKYDLPQSAQVSLKVYNVLGQEVATLVNGQQSAGYYEATWNGKNNFGTQASSGVYFYRLEATGDAGQPFVSLKKMLLLK